MDKDNFGLFIVATPIGNLEDISERAIKAIFSCDFIICENPKHSLKLLNKLGIKKKLIALHDYNETLVIKNLSNKLSNKKIVMISDAGSPLISDPGFKLVQYCIKENINITSIPGPSSIIPALQLSGLALKEFNFVGFYPKTKKQMSVFVKELINAEKTSVFFVSSHKLEVCLENLSKEIKDRSISVSKELTKINEKVFRGTSYQVKEEILKNKENLRGEFVIVVGGKTQKKPSSTDIESYSDIINILLSKFSLTDVVEIVHKLTRINKNIVYKWVLELKKSQKHS